MDLDQYVQDLGLEKPPHRRQHRRQPQGPNPHQR